MQVRFAGPSQATAGLTHRFGLRGDRGAQAEDPWRGSWSARA
jgi:hypothetical protein